MSHSLVVRAIAYTGREAVFNPSFFQMFFSLLWDEAARETRKTTILEWLFLLPGAHKSRAKISLSRIRLKLNKS